MNNFLKKTLSFILIFIICIVAIYRINNGSFKIHSDRFRDKIFFDKANYFTSFIKENESINLVLGPSNIQHSIIPDSLGKKWFSFSNGNQNIYLSYKFLDYFKDSIKIDTIIVGIFPIDFQNSLEYKYNGNENFHIYGKDSITALNTTFKRNLQALKQEYYPEILSIITSVKNDRLDEVNEIPEKWILSKQGYSYRINNKGIRLDSLFAINKSGNEHHIGNFKNVTINPNLYYFNLFQLLTKSLGIKVIYLNTPKSKFYLMGLKKVGNNKIWNSIKDSLKARQIELWDYENMNTDSLNFNYYLDEVHSSHKGAIFFTRIIRERLKK